jgi:hypothetical protein
VVGLVCIKAGSGAAVVSILRPKERHNATSLYWCGSAAIFGTATKAVCGGVKIARRAFIHAVCCGVASFWGEDGGR